MSEILKIEPLSKGKYVVALEHAPYETPCYITSWLASQSIPVKEIKVWEREPFPDHNEVLLLIIMGGPMNIYEHDIFPWLISEKKYIKEIIDLSIPVLGICLGAQLIADVLGGVVTRLPVPEFGWTHICRNNEHKIHSEIDHLFPNTLEIFQWHQDTFSIPEKAVHLYSSQTCTNQAFIYADLVIGLQFHPELYENDILNFLMLVEKDTGITEDEYPKMDILDRIFLYKQGIEFLEKLLIFLLSSSKNSLL